MSLIPEFSLPETVPLKLASAEISHESLITVDTATDLSERSQVQSLVELSFTDSPLPAAAGEWIEIDSRGLRKKVLRQGQFPHVLPQTGQQATILLTVIVDDKPVVSNVQQELTLGQCDVCEGIEQAVSTMSIGEVAVISTSCLFDREHGGDADSVIVIELELLSVRDSVDLDAMTQEQRLQLGFFKKQRGAFYYKIDEMNKSMIVFQRAVTVLDYRRPPNISNEHKLLLLASLNNLALVQLKLGLNRPCIETCKRSLSLFPNNVKALFRKGLALAELKNYKAAVLSLSQARNVDPKDQVIIHELERVTKCLNKQAIHDQALFKAVADELEAKSPVQQDDTFPKSLMYAGGAALVVVGVAMAVAFFRK